MYQGNRVTRGAIFIASGRVPKTTITLFTIFFEESTSLKAYALLTTKESRH